jgi:hypothetical protein
MKRRGFFGSLVALAIAPKVQIEAPLGRPIHVSEHQDRFQDERDYAHLAVDALLASPDLIAGKVQLTRGIRELPPRDGYVRREYDGTWLLVIQARHKAGKNG